MSMIHSLAVDPPVVGKLCDLGKSCDATAPELKVGLSVSIPAQERHELITKLACTTSSPSVSTETNHYRQRPGSEARHCFRQCLLGGLRAAWKNKDAEAHFLRLVDLLDGDGCIVFAGLLNASNFQVLIDEFTKAMSVSGRGAFLHSYVNLADHSAFLKDSRFNTAFAHPLLLALMAYAMGGPIGMTDVRGKDTPPISVNAQDNMLHIDNSPFRQEYKVLLCWDHGSVKGPNGQHFVFLPGTHTGNRSIRRDQHGKPWSTENDSIFLTDEALDGLLKFQKMARGGSAVIEVNHPAKPVSVLFSAASLVHHRYRTEHGNSRSCIIAAFHLAAFHLAAFHLAAFHLAAENPGSVVGKTALDPSQDLPGSVVSCRDDLTHSTFMSLLLQEAERIESKISEITSPVAGNCKDVSCIVDIDSLALQPDALLRWRETVVNSPSASNIRLSRNARLSTTQKQLSPESLAQRIATVMQYDKHGLLDLILYHDGHEEQRKPARRMIWSMVPEQIVESLASWIANGAESDDDFFSFAVADIVEPQVLKGLADKLAARIEACLVAKSTSRSDHHDKQLQLWFSFHQLLIDLAESIVRCEKVETFISTSLFMFWTVHHLLPALDAETKLKASEAGNTFLRCYLTTVLLLESS